jgi:uncharacterized protein
MHSKIYTGWVAHQRFAPKKHGFKYRAFMMYLDLDELPTLFNGASFWSFNKSNIASFKRADYYGDPQKPLKAEISNLVYAATGQYPRGAVRVLTNMRYFGHCFNPVSFYYCFEADNTLQAIITHITNTPWGEDYAYVHDFNDKSVGEKTIKKTTNGDITAFKLDKKFHVSPFMPMQINYDWAFKLHQNQLFVHMKNFKNNTEIFNATLSLQAQEITAKALNLLLIQYPVMTVKVVLGIYWNALLLWLKRVPSYSHPNSLK